MDPHLAQTIQELKRQVERIDKELQTIEDTQRTLWEWAQDHSKALDSIDPNWRDKIR